ncbi:MAG TPA: flagellar hook capping protein [Syntrophobacteraceae bacterium]|nr:flagellar hook capping protein [Syntrophobacteraceae bacterium]
MSTAVSQASQALSSLLGTTSSSTSTNATTPSSSTQNTSKTTSSASAAASKLGMNDFLTLFTTQLQYQDPTNPMESYELASQLASFSSVEQLTNLNSSIKDIQSYLTSLVSTQMVSMMGKEVVGSGNTMELQDGEISSGSYQIGSAAKVTVSIYDENGSLVRTQSLGQQSAGTHAISWDGRNNAGTKVSNGNYTFKVEAVGSDGNAVSAQTKVQGTVSSVRMENGTSYLLLNGSDSLKLSATDVLEVSYPEAA